MHSVNIKITRPIAMLLDKFSDMFLNRRTNYAEKSEQEF
jgi:hypothetical protein